MSHISKGLLQRSYYYFPKGSFINFFMKKFEPEIIRKDNYVMERSPPIIVDKVYLFNNNINFRETVGSYEIDEDFSKDKAFKNSDNFCINSRLLFATNGILITEKIDIIGKNNQIQFNYQINKNRENTYFANLKLDEYEFFRIHMSNVYDENNQRRPKFYNKILHKLEK
jgi:hypothetical protein